MPKLRGKCFKHWHVGALCSWMTLYLTTDAIVFTRKKLVPFCHLQMLGSGLGGDPALSSSGFLPGDFSSDTWYWLNCTVSTELLLRQSNIEGIPTNSKHRPHQHYRYVNILTQHPTSFCRVDKKCYESKMHILKYKSKLCWVPCPLTRSIHIF